MYNIQEGPKVISGNPLQPEGHEKGVRKTNPPNGLLAAAETRPKVAQCLEIGRGRLYGRLPIKSAE